MLKLLTLLGVLGLALAGPPVTKSRQEIEEFKAFLEKTKDDGLKLEERMAANPLASAWENSGKFEGDILFDYDQMETMLEDFATGGRMAWRGVQWPGNTVVFEFGAGQFTQHQQNMIWDSIRAIEANSCVRFRQRTNENAFVRLMNRPDGCYAHIGYWPSRGVHDMNLANGCFTHVIIVHEWLHILGFVHMQSTYNRYDYVRINWQNIQAGMAHNFDRYESNVVDNLQVPYEYTSCMHYSSHAFSANGWPTIEATRWHDGVMGQQDYVTGWDWLRVRRYYNCPGGWDGELEIAEENNEIEREENKEAAQEVMVEN